MWIMPRRPSLVHSRHTAHGPDTHGDARRFRKLLGLRGPHFARTHK